MKLFKRVGLIILITTLFYPNLTLGISIPRPIGNEGRIKVINYTPNTIFKFIGHYTYHSIIEFGSDEEIKTITMGTPTAWQIKPDGNRIFLKPIEDDATTNMTVITNKRMYMFEVHGSYANGIDDEDLSFMVKFIYPGDGINNLSGGGGISVVSNTVPPNLANPQMYNFKYKISGKRTAIEPILIFDDGEFTYFKFRDVNTSIPSIFMVDQDGNEGLINYRIFAGYVVVERVHSTFTLRHGHEVLCVFNEDYNQYTGKDFSDSVKDIKKTENKESKAK